MGIISGTKRKIASIRRTVTHGNPDPDFDHSNAQHYEKNSSEKWVKENFNQLYQGIQTSKGEGRYWSGPEDQTVKDFFAGSQKDWEEFAASIKEKMSMEIGPGPCGSLCIWWWIKTRILIDPLIMEYKDFQLMTFKKTWFTDEMQLLAQNAETTIPNLMGAIDGVIICRNALDHCDDPFQILQNISKYAKPGCQLLLWTDLWHLHGHNEGHSNITKDKKEFEAALKNLDFDILHIFEYKERDSINYGCRAVKKS